MNKRKEINRKIGFHHTKLTHKLTSKNLNLKLDHHTGGKWFIHSHKQIIVSTFTNPSNKYATMCFKFLVILSYAAIWFFFGIASNKSQRPITFTHHQAKRNFCALAQDTNCYGINKHYSMLILEQKTVPCIDPFCAENILLREHCVNIHARCVAKP